MAKWEAWLVPQAARVALLLLAVVALLGSAPNAAALREGGAAAAAAAAAAVAAQPEVTLVGRFTPGPDGKPAKLPQLFTWSGASASVAFEGAAAVTVVLNGGMAGLPKGTDAELIRGTKSKSTFPWCFFRFEIDGVAAGIGETSIAKPMMTWTSGALTPGPHVLTITKLSEARYGAAWLQSVSLPRGGRFLAAPPSPGALSGRRILFLGDSFTAGWGNTGNRACGGADASNMDTQQAYSMVAARALGADAQVLAWSGAGLMTYTKSYRTDWSTAMVRAAAPTMGELLARVDALDPRRAYIPAGFQPQARGVVVLAAGANDFYNTTLNRAGYVVQGGYGLPHGLDAWVQGIAALVAQVRRTYPQATVISLVWPMEVLLAGLQKPEQALAYSQYAAAAYSRLVQAGVRDIHLLQLSGEAFKNTNWCGAHPDVTAHLKLAAQLQQFIQGVVPGWQAGKKQGA